MGAIPTPSRIAAEKAFHRDIKSANILLDRQGAEIPMLAEKWTLDSVFCCKKSGQPQKEPEMEHEIVMSDVVCLIFL